MRAAAACLLLIALAACGPDAAETPAEGAPVAPPPPAPTVVDSTSGDTLVVGAAEVEAAPVTVVSLTDGDRACYMEVRGAAGTRTEMADFNFCERDDLVGQEVVLTFVPTEVMAASCEGDPECRDTEQVRLVIAADLTADGLDPAE